MTEDLWNPQVYSAFTQERARPARDLISRIDLAAPQVICDVGCGTGNVTRHLAARWPNAVVFGVDRSAAMLAAAKEEPSHIHWVEADLSSWEPPEPVDLLFSNAALHWLGGHERLFVRLLQSIRPGGVLAVQMPRNHSEPSHTAILESIEASEYRDTLRPLMPGTPVARPEWYTRLLLAHAQSVDVWETVYVHVLRGEDPVAVWTSGTVLRPLLAVLDADGRRTFLADYAHRVARAYPRGEDGITLFPFRRLFMVVKR